jgi:hypothetical protein
MNKRMTSKNNLELALMSRNMDLKDLKCEAILIMCKDLIQEYLKSNKEGKLVSLRDESEESKLSNNIILNEMKKLDELLRDSVLSVDNLQIIISAQYFSPSNKMKARLVEPTAFFYNILSRSFIVKIKELQKNEKKLSWIPDQLAVFLILDMIEKGYTFKKFPFLQNYDFSTLINIYTKNNIELKKELGITLFSPKESQTIITKMQMLSLYIVEKIISSKYEKPKANKRR